jgi:hypothetical protein
MSEVHQVVIQICAPRKQYPLGQIAYGYYTLADGVVTMTDRRGKPAEDTTGKKYTHKLAPDEDAGAVARRMTRELRLALRDNSAPVHGFDRPIAYPKIKCV